MNLIGRGVLGGFARAASRQREAQRESPWHALGRDFIHASERGFVRRFAALTGLRRGAFALEPISVHFNCDSLA
jgi:hypothetical protein